MLAAQHKMSELEVQKLIEGERAHQGMMLGARSSLTPHTVTGHVLLLDHYVGKAVHEWAEAPATPNALDQVRKVSAIAVSCLETYGGEGGHGQMRQEVYQSARTTRSVPDAWVSDLAEALIRLRSIVRHAEEAVHANDTRAAVNLMVDVVAHTMAIMMVHGAPRRRES